jgi:hypothetical protein
MDDFTTAPGRPNDFDLVQGDANAVAPGRRMLSSMAPTLAWRGKEAIALGGRGGPRIPTALSSLSALSRRPVRAAVARRASTINGSRLTRKGLLRRRQPSRARRGHALPRRRISGVVRRADGTFEVAAICADESGGPAPAGGGPGWRR